MKLYKKKCISIFNHKALSILYLKNKTKEKLNEFVKKR